ncbi:carbon-nitrogen hydrolase family protein [Zophobihabitans entericus]|uniref:Carbon-nitrogen hydrolase family protein n=1 Tax=Zophobihabitans entericus TaxID=1635327 RepID=A0A6G9I987_9GAMM|nr:carbon-nitrogen hydrolase family protein [Zophobihabitans entericus]QIQ20284.1 carbon-nitrogen hydrolase family protein [Zophobihabitans entericus]
MKRAVTVASIQMVSGECVKQNLLKAEQLIARAAEQGAAFVVLPEYFCLISADPKAKLAIKESVGSGLIQDTLSQIAKKYQIWLAGGSIPLDIGITDKVTNSLMLYAPDGTLYSRYDKVHLFSIHTEQMVHDEGQTMVAGNQVVTVDLPFGRVGLAICYDIRFPQFLAAMGDIDILLLPAAFTYQTGRSHWELLLRARAIDNQCFVVASAQGGLHQSGRQTWGHSMIVDPWANILGCLPEGEGVVIATLNLSEVAQVRQSLPVVRDRKQVKFQSQVE